MDIDKARDIHRLYVRRADLRSLIITMQSCIKATPHGTTNITVPVSWLPAMVKIAEAELSELDEKINEL